MLTQSMFIVLMGVQGAGKGEQAKFLTESLGIPHISTGDLFRVMKERSDPLALRVREILASGKLVPDKEACEVVEDRLRQPDALEGAVLDGFPRTSAQAAWLDGYLASRQCKVGIVLHLQLDPYIAFKRVFGRLTSSEGERKSYNIYFNSEGIKWDFQKDPNHRYPPSLAGTELFSETSLIRRDDDAHAGSIIERIDGFLLIATEISRYYSQKNIYVEIDANNTIDAVRQSVMKEIERFFRADSRAH